MMDEEYQIVYQEPVEDSTWTIIGHGIRDYNTSQAGDDQAQRLAFVLQGPDGIIAGGVIAVVYWDWLYIDLMWMKEAVRGHGYGSRLLAQVEEEGRRRGAKHAYLDTFSFQAPGFYKKHGYRVFGELDGFPAGHQRFFLTKQL